MKALSTLVIISLLLFSCKETKNAEQDNQQKTSENTEQVDTENLESQKDFPESIKAVFKAHGGYGNWKAMNNLCFQMEGRNGTEIHTTDLKNRNAKIETPKYTMGFDGDNFWLDQDEAVYDPKRVKYSHNLMFYFYAMPFILGDDGITYAAVEPLTVDDKTYDGVKISYGDGVGYSAKDNYIVYSDPDTNKMAWLAYTATFGGDETSDDFSFIKYDTWEEVNGLLLPKTLQWHKVEDGKPTEMRNEMVFENITATETKLEASVFEKPEDAVVAE